MRPALVDSLVFVHVVSIHVLARGATGTPSSTRARCSGFNPRARTGRDHGVSRELWVPRVVSIHAPAPGATGVRAHGGGRCDVSIHAPAWGATSATMPRIASTQFQSTRPHGARHYCPTCGARVVGVSIHTPARGATVGRARRVPNRYVSIHAPARGATARALDARAVSQVVSIHASARGATVGAVEGRGLRVVSIHAPARGATGAVQVAGREARFQSTRPHGARRAGRLLGQGPVGFNPRARTGRDFLAARACSGARSFNPRARTGGDAERLRHHGRLHVSIHAPARGATRGAARVISIARVSIHAPPRGATNDGLESTYSALFQSTRPHGARPPDGPVAVPV